MIGGDAGLCAALAGVQFHLYAVVAGIADGDGAALHEEILLAVDAVLDGRGDVDHEVLHLAVFLAVDGVAGVAGDVERPLALELQVALAMQAAVVGLVGAVGQVVDGAALGADRDALAVLDVDGWAAGVGECHAVQFDATLERALQQEAAVGRGAREGVDDLAVGIALRGVDASERLCLGDDHVRRRAAADGDVTADVGSNGHGGRSAVVGYLNGVVADGSGSGRCQYE